MIWGKNRKNFPLPPELMFRRRQTVCAMGVLYYYQGARTIQVTDVVWDDGVWQLI